MFGRSRPPKAPLWVETRVDMELFARRLAHLMGEAFFNETSEEPWTLARPLLKDSRHAVESWAVRRLSRSDPGACLGAWDKWVEQSSGCDDLVVIEGLRQICKVWLAEKADLSIDVHPAFPDAMAVLVGFPVVAADAALVSQNRSRGPFSNWTMHRSGQFNAQQIGYLAALRFQLEGKPGDGRERDLRLDARQVFRQASTWLTWKRAQSIPALFDAKVVPAESRDQNQLANWLAGEDDEFSESAARVLKHVEPFKSMVKLPSEVQRAVRDELVHPRLSRRSHAIDLVARCNGSPETRAELNRFPRKEPAVVKLKRLTSLRALGEDISANERMLDQLLRDDTLDHLPLLELIGDVGKPLQTLGSRLLGHLIEAIHFEQEDGIEALCRTLKRVDAPIEKLMDAKRLSDAKREAVFQAMRSISD
ncbi:MAG: hypothetical protein AAF664_13440 [Planctomycetota bacterium]